MEPLIIYRSVNREGATFALKPGSRERVQSRFGDAAHVRPRIFIAHDTRVNYDEMHVGLASQVVQLLTGLSSQRLQELGEVVFLDPETDAEIPQSAA